MKILIVDNKITEKCERALLKRGFTLLKLPSHKKLSKAICSHPDTLIFCKDGRLITSADYCDEAPWIFSDLREYAPELKISFSADSLGEKYPSDCLFNALTVKNKLFAKTDSLCSMVIDFAKEQGYDICHVKQGYPACSVLAFGNNAITADKGLGKLMENAGISVTYITPGGISLPPHEYGFIGGASGVVGRKIYFFGNILNHPDGEIICRTIHDAGYTPISLSDEPLTDFGGIISL